MPTDDNIDRRKFLKAAGGAAVGASVAGCLGGGGDGGDGGDGNGTSDGGDGGGGMDTSGLGDKADGKIDVPGTRAEIYKKAGALAHEQAPWVFMDHAEDIRGLHNRVSGFILAPISGPFLNRVSLEGSDTLTYARGADSGTLDPQNTTSGEDVKVTNQIYDTLIKFKAGETSLTEGLATDWKFEDDTTLNLTLREGVMFHNGEEFTASDFVATYRRFVDPEYEYYAGKKYTSAYGPFTLGNWVDEVKANGDYELTISLSQKYAPFLRNLAMFASAVLSEKAIKDMGQGLKKNPVGTGPFKFESWDKSNTQIRLSANGDYWGESPKVSELVFTAIGSNTSRAQSLDAGDVDIIDGLGADSLSIVENSSNAKVVRQKGINIGYMAFNMARKKEFRDKRVRQAISYAIDTKSIVENVFSGIAVQASQPIPSNVMGYNEKLDPYPHDPDKAKKLLKDAGYGDGFKFELATFKNPRTYNPNPSQAAEVVKSNLSQVGIEVTINKQSFNPFLSYTSKGKHDACFLGWMTDNADPDNFYYSLLHPGVSMDKVPEGQDWVSFDTKNFNTLDVAAWANKDYMKLVEKGQTTYE